MKKVVKKPTKKRTAFKPVNKGEIIEFPCKGKIKINHITPLAPEGKVLIGIDLSGGGLCATGYTSDSKDNTLYASVPTVQINFYSEAIPLIIKTLQRLQRTIK